VAQIPQVIRPARERAREGAAALVADSARLAALVEDTARRVRASLDG
jgi:hypothetical protein